MLHAKSSVCVLVSVLLSLTSAPNDAPHGGVKGVAKKDPSTCILSATAMRKSSRRAARADFWLAIGKAVNERPAHFFACLQDAWVDRSEAMNLVDEQYNARVALCAMLPGGRYDPNMNPNRFSPNVTNSYLPLVPGRTLVYEKTTAEGLERVEDTTEMQTTEIAGIQCRVVHAVEFLNGEVTEDTVDWFAQKNNGSVWYLGEIAQNFEDGRLDNLDGSWQTGKDKAKAGIIMKANPSVGQVYRQEYLLGEAEDVAHVISSGETVTVPAGTFVNCIQTEEWTPLSPGSCERKFYAPGVGLVLEVDLETGDRLELIQIIN